ncbi:hypothetical protein NQ315_014368 [Exocentrus adspersus]|uniref:Transposable element P transposase-like RNase H C-terminal domain-containing protein n=1 Tax=Exocentrus adspersus TaxID=1586481 RepID=A0AAV8V7X0_9CUCU|nr:hypothetical protein NQ315_014368 [Exocentrus adspersus]
MKVSMCTQVFSHTVAAAINVLAFTGVIIDTGTETLKLDKQASDTADLLNFLAKLFDSLNGCSFKAKAGKSLRSAVTQNSNHLEFWNEALQKLKTFHFVKNGTFWSPPSLLNLILTIKNFKKLHSTISNLGFNYMMPRTFNQDPVENFFGKIRQRGSRNINPTPSDFISYYKNLLVNGLTSKHSVGANCEDDNSDLFLTLQRLITQVCIIGCLIRLML